METAHRVSPTIRFSDSFIHFSRFHGWRNRKLRSSLPTRPVIDCAAICWQNNDSVWYASPLFGCSISGMLSWEIKQYKFWQGLERIRLRTNPRDSFLRGVTRRLYDYLFTQMAQRPKMYLGLPNWSQSLVNWIICFRYMHVSDSGQTDLMFVVIN